MPQRPPSIAAAVAPAPSVRTPERRPSSSGRGYGARWQKVAARHLAQYPLCARCESHGLTSLAALVDHIRPVNGEGDAGFYNPDNHQSLCRRCHAVKTHADRRAGLTRRDGR